MKYEDLKIGKVYWIKTGHGNAIQGVLTGFNHDNSAGLFGEIPRRLKHIHLTKSEAEKDDY